MKTPPTLDKAQWAAELIHEYLDHVEDQEDLPHRGRKIATLEWIGVSCYRSKSPAPQEDLWRVHFDGGEIPDLLLQIGEDGTIFTPASVEYSSEDLYPDLYPQN